MQTEDGAVEALETTGWEGLRREREQKKRTGVGWARAVSEEGRHPGGGQRDEGLSVSVSVSMRVHARSEMSLDDKLSKLLQLEGAAQGCGRRGRRGNVGRGAGGRFTRSIEMRDLGGRGVGGRVGEGGSADGPGSGEGRGSAAGGGGGTVGKEGARGKAMVSSGGRSEAEEPSTWQGLQCCPEMGGREVSGLSVDEQQVLGEVVSLAAAGVARVEEETMSSAVSSAAMAYAVYGVVSVFN